MLELSTPGVNGTGASALTKRQLARRTGKVSRQNSSVKNLIVNADDLGWTEGVNRGIAAAHRHGIVTSASLLANGGAFDGAVKTAAELPGLGVGVHLNLSNGKPTAPSDQVRSLLNQEGQFSGGPESLLLRLAAQRVDPREVETEWEAQIAKVRAAGIRPTHLDGHKHVHMLPGLFAVALRLAKKHGIEALRVSHEASPLRTALSGGQETTAVLLKQGVEARGLKLLARDAREMAERSGIATTDYFCGIAQTGVLSKAGVQKL